MFELRQLGKTILRSELFQAVAARSANAVLSGAYRSNRQVDGSSDAQSELAGHWPIILAIWHGQQLLVPYAAPNGHRFVCLVSRSADAEINARVIRLAGHDVIRGSGGRRRNATAQKGGVGAMIAMRDALRLGVNVVMIADISKGQPRQAGAGIVRLARLSGRPIVPMALATSRHHVLARTWDKTTLNFPFGKRCMRLGEPIYVSSDAQEAELTQARQRVTAELNRVTHEAARAVGRRL